MSPLEVVGTFALWVGGFWLSGVIIGNLVAYGVGGLSGLMVARQALIAWGFVYVAATMIYFIAT